MPTERTTRRTAENREMYKRLRVYEALGIGFSCVLAAFFVFMFVVVPVRMIDDAMSPALRENDVVLVFSPSKLFSAPKRGDIVAVKSDGGDAGYRIVRIIALGGETVELKGGGIYVDGGLLTEAGYETRGTERLPDTGIIEIPKDGFYVLCDDRSALGEGYAEEYALVGRRQIRGEVFMLLHPFGRLGFFGSGER